MSSPAVATPPQTCLTLGGFEIDGDMLSGTSNCTNGGTDWDNVMPKSTSQGGTYTTANVNKDDADPSNWYGTGATPDKSGMATAFARTGVQNGHFDAFVGWTRPQTGGTGAYAIEIDNLPSRIGNGVPQPDRSGGGFVVFLDFTGGGLPSFTKACSFTSVADYPGTCSTNSAGFLFAANAATIAAGDNPISGEAEAPGGFLEVALDLTELTGIHPTCPAPASASLYLRSITGAGDKNLKGWVAPLDVAPDSTCVAPDISTTATPGNSTIDGLSVVAPGTAQHDDVTVGGSAGPAIGTVKFYLCQPADVTANQGCVSGGDLVSTKTLDANGKASSDAVSGSSDTTPGTYCWRAEYTRGANDHNYLSGTHTNYGSECFTVAHASPSIATQITVTTTPGAAAGSLGLTTVSDTATLSNVVSGADLSGQTVTFSLYGPFASAPDGTVCTGLPVATRTGALTKVDATTWQASTTLPSATVKPTAAGYYTWVASYGGDAINDAASDGCGQAKETTQIVGPQLSVEKDTTTPTISAGDTAAFDIKLRNLGGGTATNISVTDPLPILAGGGTWTLTSNYGCTIGADPGRAGGQLVTCAIATFNPTNDWVTIASVSAPTGPADCGTITNTAFLTADNTPPGQDGASVTVNCPALTIVKTAANGTVNAGDQISYTVTVTNNGTGKAYNVVVTDTVPASAGLNWSAVSSAAQQCSLSAGTYSCPFGTLAPGASGTVTFTSPTTPASCGTVTNQAGASLSNGTSVSSAIVPITVNCPNVTITKSADATAVNAGTPIGYTITLANAGPGDAYGVTLTDVLPTGTGITWSIDAARSFGPLGCAISSGTLSCTSGTLHAGTSQVIHITSPTSYDSCKQYDNTATATVTNQTNGALSAGPATTTVACADLVITKTPDHAKPVNVGSDIGFTITITNNGSGDATGVHVTDALPTGPGISWIVDSQTGTLSCTPTTAVTTLSCTGDLAKGASEVVHIYSATSWTDTNGVVVNSCDNGNNGEYDNTATLRWDNGPNKTISSATVHETVQCPNLSITKTADAASVSVGSTIGFTVEVTNAGPGTATAATISDPLPSGPGVNWGIATVSGTAAINCSINLVAGVQVLTCNLGDLAANADVKVHVTSTTSWTTTINGDVNSCDGGPHNDGVYDNTATLHVTNAPSLDDSASTTVTCPDVVVSKTADAATVSVGTAIGFTVTVANNGAGSATNVRVHDPLPVGQGILWTVDAIDGASGPFNSPACVVTVSNNAQTLDCSFGDMAPGASHTVHISSSTGWTAQANSCGNYPNVATALVDNQPGLPQSNQAQVVVQCPNLSVVKTADAASVDVGSPIGFSIEVTNAGPGIATGVMINDPLPGGPGISWSIASVSGTDPTNCAITGPAGAQVLACTLGALTTADDVIVHVTSPTSWTDAGTVVNSCTGGRSGTYDNTATLSAGNQPPQTSSAATTVQCPSLTFTKTADAGTVNVGDPIGFVVTVANAGPGAATGVQISDPLPGGPGVSWSIDAAHTTATGCAITGTAPTQTLSCTLTSALAASASASVHITSATSWTDTSGTVVNSCTGGNGSGLYDNTATLTLTNAPAPAPAEDSTLVQCPNLTLTKTADNTSVSVGSQIGFTIEAKNAGPGTAKAVTLDDPLPAGPGVNWQPVPATFPATCQIIGTGPAAQDLSCNLGDLAPNADVLIHVVSDTSWTGTGQNAVNSCDNGHNGVYDNTATLTPVNAPAVTASATTAVQCPNLTVVKTADATVVNAGDTIGYTVTVTNTGAGDATAVTITDTVPADAGLNWSVDQTSKGVTCGPISNGVLTCTAGTLAANGGSASVHLTSPTTAATCGTVTNTASTASSNGASGTSQPAEVTVNCPNVTLTKTADARAVNAGTPIGYTVTLANAGPGDAYGVTLSDPLPTGTGISWSVDSSTGPLSCSIAAGTLSCAAGTLPAGSSQVIHVVSQTSFASCADYENTATAGVTNQVNGSLSAGPIPTSVLCADLVIAKTADHSAPVNVGTPIGFTVTVTNNGAGDAKGVTVSDPLPTGPGIAWTVAAQTGPMSCSVSGSDLTCTGDLAAAAVQTVHITSPTVWQDTPQGAVNSCLGGNGAGVYDNTATVTWTNGPALPISSNQATETVQCPAVTITKTADADTVNVGQAIGFTVVVANAGPGDATDVMVNDPLPGGPGVEWSIDAANSTTTDCSINGTAPTQTLTCDLGTLDADADVAVHVVSATSWTGTGDTAVNSCTGGQGQDGTYDNTATLTIGNAPGSSASASTTVQCPAVTITKTADAASVNVGQSIGFTVAVANAGPGDATDVTIDDPLPTGSAESGVLWTADGNAACSIAVTNTGQTLSCSFATLKAGETQTVHVSSPTSRTFDTGGAPLTDSCGTYDNTATLAVGNQPGSPDASASTSVLCPTLSITKIGDAPASSGLGQPGQPIGYTLTGTNTGEGTAVNAVLTDPLPGTPLAGVAAPGHLNWSIDRSSVGSNCSISGDIGSQVLTCTPGDLAPGEAVSVHITSPTDDSTCGTINNTGFFTADNAEQVHDDATLGVICAAIITPTPTPTPTTTPPSHSPQGTTVPPLPNTGAGPIGDEIGWAIGLFGLGLLLLLAGTRRRHRRAH